MPAIVWNAALLVGVPEIDRQHQHLVEFLNVTYDECKRGAPVESITYAIGELLDYSTYHFSCEERWMVDTAYPDLARHSGEHEVFKARIVELSGNNKLNIKVCLEIISLMTNWLMHHLQNADTDFGTFLKEHNIRKLLLPKNDSLSTLS